jgi:nicotinate-nucleotide pyrophosphorylase (carboxylating)
MKAVQMLKEDFVRALVAEDVGRGDLFARIGESRPVRAYVVAKSDGIFAGREYLEVLGAIFNIDIEWMIRDGEPFEKGKKIFELYCEDSRSLLSLERSILDIVLHASGIATMTRSYVDKIAQYDCILLDTRKTRPMLREFEKYAVRCGGGVNHRMGLDDCLMLKDTHLGIIEDLDAFMKEMRRKIPFTSKVEIECEDMEMVKKAMKAGADIVMCDNMSIEEIVEVVKYRESFYPHILLEASGNITLENIEEIAESGVDAISSGSIIHQARWPDLSMRVMG